MISRITGTIVEWRESSVLVDVQGISYDVLVAPTIVQSLQQQYAPRDQLTLVTYHYLQGDMTRSVPMLIGFTNAVEREFFERFISVSGVGPKAALKAFVHPISEIASAIDAGHIAFLKSLPGIGTQRAKDIVAKLQGKVGKFGLLQDQNGRLPAKPLPPSMEGVEEEALAVLTQLQYSKPEATAMIRKASQRLSNVTSTEDLLNEIYRLRIQQPVASEQ